MHENIKRFMGEITPPVILRMVKIAFHSNRKAHSNSGNGREKNSDWYDTSFEKKNDDWQMHYSESEYYFIWTVIADRIVTSGVKFILEIGCGPGQLACLLRDKGCRGYHGFDFSPKRIERAKRICPDFAFSLQDAFQTDLFTSLHYDAVICTEFLEHIEQDIEVLKKIKSGTVFYGTVPNFPFVSHVRYFRSEDEVVSRYRSCFSELRVDAFLADGAGKTFYLLEGTIS